MPEMILGYLISNFLIDSHQYEQWHRLSLDELKGTLAAARIMTAAEFDGLSNQIAAGAELNTVENQYGYQDAPEID
ncbi:hypothetical protein [Sporomusa sp.]|uniref:hypothetical protein n=1 Tax=Sporomusa sp. TaxID=2078658 RepID=UPI002C8C9403|nr:hypothetical protein [Sporomusa sp.]HWR06026.1 hypothetical protein [Sporomusa sp.]